jgi:hypothetical protein
MPIGGPALPQQKDILFTRRGGRRQESLDTRLEAASWLLFSEDAGRFDASGVKIRME